MGAVTQIEPVDVCMKEMKVIKMTVMYVYLERPMERGHGLSSQWMTDGDVALHRERRYRQHRR